MSDKYQNKYRIPSARLQGYDYGQNGAYFITICTNNREHYFGEISNNEMILNQIGLIVKNEWIITPEMRPDMNLRLDEYIIMPNHFHAIIVIGENEYNLKHSTEYGMERRDAMHRVSTTTTNPNPGNKFGPQSKNLASIIRGFKSAVSTNTRKTNTFFAWQSRFHDHIIRDEAEYEKIRNYITNNPSNWKDDKFYE